MTLDIDVRGLTLKYGRQRALEQISFKLQGGKIYGLLGRNGSGKTSLLSVLASLRKQSDGEVCIDGQHPYENAAITSQVCMVGESVHFADSSSIKDVLRLAEICWPNWNEEYARRLLDTYELPLKKRIDGLSRGMKSALSVTIGLASRAPVTIFDEAYIGMDAPSRYAFYDEVLKDYMEHPRTIILSSHLIEEIENLFEEVLILDRGKLLIHEESEAFRARGASITGPEHQIDAIASELQVLNEQRLGSTKSVTVYGELPAHLLERIEKDGLALGPVSLQDLFVHMTKKGVKEQ